jgi:hypothetical protein
LLAEREFSSQEWAPLDQRRFRIEPENYRTAASVANVGALRATRLTGNGATETTLRVVRLAAGEATLPTQDAASAIVVC